MLKKSSILLIIVLLLSSSPDNSGQYKNSGKVVVDSIGREVIIPGNMERIGCLYAFSAHVVTMLGRGDDIKAVVFGSKRDKLLNEINPVIGDAGVPTDDGILNIEEILRLDLDLIFLKGETAQLESEIEKLERFGLSYIVIDYRTIEEQMDAIEIIGRAIGREDKAFEYNEYYRNTLNWTKEKLSGLGEGERVRVYHSVNEASRTDAPGTIGAQWTEIAGAINVSVGDTLRFHDNKHFASLEQIYLWDPDIIIFNQEGVGDYIMNSDKWGGLKAVRRKKVFQIPVGISRWGHPGGMETPLDVLWAAKKLYPEKFTDLDIRKETKQFYKDFFNFTVSSEMVDQILSGKGMRLSKGTIRSEGKK